MNFVIKVSLRLLDFLNSSFRVEILDLSFLYSVESSNKFISETFFFPLSTTLEDDSGAEGDPPLTNLILPEVVFSDLLKGVSRKPNPLLWRRCESFQICVRLRSHFV